MVVRLRGAFSTESLSTFPFSTGRLPLMPEEPEQGGMLDEGKQVSNLFSALVPDSWPPIAVEPPTQDAIGWNRFAWHTSPLVHPQL